MSAIASNMNRAHARAFRGTNSSVQTCGEVGESRCPLIANARAGIAERLHDSVIQELFALSLGLEHLLQAGTASGRRDPGRDLRSARQLGSGLSRRVGVGGPHVPRLGRDCDRRRRSRAGGVPTRRGRRGQGVGVERDSPRACPTRRGRCAPSERADRSGNRRRRSGLPAPKRHGRRRCGNGPTSTTDGREFLAAAECDGWDVSAMEDSEQGGKR